MKLSGQSSRKTLSVQPVPLYVDSIQISSNPVKIALVLCTSDPPVHPVLLAFAGPRVQFPYSPSRAPHVSYPSTRRLPSREPPSPERRPFIRRRSPTHPRRAAAPPHFLRRAPPSLPLRSATSPPCPVLVLPRPPQPNPSASRCRLAPPPPHSSGGHHPSALPRAVPRHLCSDLEFSSHLEHKVLDVLPQGKFRVDFFRFSVVWFKLVFYSSFATRPSLLSHLCTHCHLLPSLVHILSHI